MQKIKVKTSLIEHNKTVPTIKFETTGILDENIITYDENNLKITLTLEDKKVTLKRTDDNYELILLFEENLLSTGLCLLKAEQASIPLAIKTSKLEIDVNKIVVDYQLDVDDELTNYFTFILTYEVIK